MKKQNLTVANAVTELFTALQAEASATARVMDKFITAYSEAPQGVCDYLDNLKAKASGKQAPKSAKDLYAKKRKQIQNACTREPILAELFGDKADRTKLSIVQVNKKFTWVVEEAPVEVVTEDSPEGTESDTTEAVDTTEDTPSIGKDLTTVALEYIAEHGKTETIALEIEQTIDALQETLANLEALKVA